MLLTQTQDQNTDEVHNNKLQIIGKLTASLLHEIRNPLSAIKLSLNYMEMFEDELSPEIYESVIACSEGVNRIQFLIDQLLGFSRKNKEDLKLLSINEVSDNVLTLLDSLLKKDNINVEKRYRNNISYMYFNENKLLQIFINLITNAVEAVSSNGKIIISTSEKVTENESLLIWEIEDNGVGIKKEDMNKIFNDFFTKKKNGTGLGLSVCKMLLEECNAKIDCSSTLGFGTKFTVTFKHTVVEKYGK